MNVVVDTSVWSLALRRRPLAPNAVATELATLIGEGRALLVGIVRQELLSGVRAEAQFERLRLALRPFPDLAPTMDDHEEAASLFNACRRHGVQGSAVDFLLCAVAIRRGVALFTTDADFDSYARWVPLTLHRPRE